MPGRLVAGRKRQQRDVACLLDGASKPALVRGANSGQAAGNNLPALGHKALQKAHVTVGDRVNLFRAEFADFSAPEKFPAARAGGARRARA